MKQHRFDEIRELFQELCDTPVVSRQARLEALESTNHGLRLEVESLLRFADESRLAIDDAPSRIMQLLNDLAQPGLTAATAPPLHIGPYTVLDQLGIGGMGVVYRASQHSPISREVAIKLVRPGMATAEVLARFETERQTLASLNHPNIAAIYDAGLTDEPGGGRPYFVMPCVIGEPITTYCDTHGLDVVSRLTLLVTVCDAVQHAHRRGVIHRDLKPSNILVETVDGQASPRVIDFGIAKAWQRNGADPMNETQPGQLLGAARYMSPEQADPRGQVDTRTDVYSLGVILYELLCGQTPVYPNQAGNSLSGGPAMLIREEPLAPGDLDRKLRGELTWITMKALAHEPSRRYESPGDLADDLRRHARGEAVEAGPPTVAYRIRRAVNRHRLAAGGIVAVLIVLLAGVAGILWQAAQTQREAYSNQQVSRFLHDLLASNEPRYQKGEPLTLRIALDRASARLREQPDLTPITQARLHNTIAATYYGLGALDDAETHGRSALEIFTQMLGESSAETIKVMANLSMALADRGAVQDAEPMARRAFELAKQHLSANSPEQSQATHNYALILDKLRRYDEAERLYRVALSIDRARNDDRGVSMVLSNLGGMLGRQGRADEALAMLRQCVEHSRQKLGDDYPTTLTALQNLAALQQKSHPTEAIAVLREVVQRSSAVLGEGHPHAINYRRDLTLCLMTAGRFDESEIVARDGVAISERHLGPIADITAHLHELWAASIGLQGRLDESVELAKSWYDSLVRSNGVEHPITRRAARLIAEGYDSLGDDKNEQHWRDVASSNAAP